MPQWQAQRLVLRVSLISDTRLSNMVLNYARKASRDIKKPSLSVDVDKQEGKKLDNTRRTLLKHDQSSRESLL